MDLRDAATFARCMALSLLDSTRTQELLTGEEISSVGRMAALRPMMEASEEGRAILAERPWISTETVDYDALLALPEDRLGHRYAAHLRAHDLAPDPLTTPVTRGRTELDSYLLMRVRQTHDIWHALVGFGTEGHEEVLLHAFQWPQLRMPYSALVVGFGTIKHLIGERRWRLLRHALRDAVRAGRAAAPLLPAYWERHWDEPIDAVRERLGVTPARDWPAFAGQPGA